MNIKKYGAFMITKTALERYSNPSYWYRDENSTEIDNGWRIIGDTDRDDFIDDPENWTIINMNDAIELCPLVKHFYNAPIGTELFIEYDENNLVVKVTDLVTEEEISVDEIKVKYKK